MKRARKRRRLNWLLVIAMLVTSLAGTLPAAAEEAGQGGVPAAAAADTLSQTAPMPEQGGTDLAEPAGSSGASISVWAAIAKGNNGEQAVVTGYIVGHATGSLTANFNAPFSNDYNFLLADTPEERDPGKLVNVQVPSGLRGDFGLQAHPELIGRQVTVSGSLNAYNNFPGLKSVNKIELAGGGQPGGEQPGGEQPGGEQPGGEQPGGEQPGGEQPGGEQPGGEQPSGEQPETPTLPDGTGKKVLFDHTHAQTAGAADWVIDGAFSDFADGLRAAGFQVDALDRPVPFTFGESAITYDALKDYDVFILPEANIPFKAPEQAAIVQYVENGGAVFFISDHYNADRNKNRWDASEVFNGYRRGAYENPARGMSAEEANSPAMQDVISSDWLADHFGVRFRYNAIGDVNANDIVSPSQSFGITSGVEEVAMHAGSTVAILDPEKAKGVVYVPTGVPAWGNAVDSGVYNGGGRAEGPYAAIGKLGLGKAAFIGDSSPVEDATPKYVREENGQKKKTYDGFKEVDDGIFLVQTVRWLAHDENYTSFAEVPGIELDQPTVLGPEEEPAASVEPKPEPWSEPAAGYKWYDPTTFKPGSYGSSETPQPQPVFGFVHQSRLPSNEEFQIRVTADSLLPGQTINDLKVGIYLAGGAQIARFKHADGTWSDYNYSPAFSLTGDALGHAAKELTVQLKPGQAGSANLRLKQGSANALTKAVTIADVSAEPLPDDKPPVPELASIAEVRQKPDGTKVTVEGVITSEPGVFGGQGFYVQDETAGIYVFQTASGYHAGDRVRISAEKTVYNGEVELENPILIEKKGTAPLPNPIVQSGVDETNQGRMITLENVAIRNLVSASPAGSFEFDAVKTDGSSVKVRIDGRTGISQSAFSEAYPTGTRVNVTGIAAVFKGVYQLKPLSLDHVVHFDNAAPVTRAEHNGKAGQNVYNKAQVTVEWVAEDEGGSGLDYTEYRMNGGAWERVAAPLQLKNDGKYVIEYRSVDKAGNVEESKTLYINVDRLGPEVGLNGEKIVMQTADNVPFAVTVEDRASGVKKSTYYLDGKKIADPNRLQPYYLSTGKHTLSVTASDELGHKSFVKFTFEVTMDIDHLDELIDLGMEQKRIKKKEVASLLQAKVAALQKAKTKKEQQIRLNELKLIVLAQSGRGMKSEFALLFYEDLRYIGKQAS